MIGMVLLGVHFLLLDLGHDPSRLEWLIILSLLLFMFLSFGIIPVASTMLGELFKTDMKSMAGFSASMISAVCAFISTKSYQPLVISIGHQYVYWIYAAITLINLIFSIVCVPETKGKTFHVSRSSRLVASDFGSSFLLLFFSPLLLSSFSVRVRPLSRRLFLRTVRAKGFNRFRRRIADYSTDVIRLGKVLYPRAQTSRAIISDRTVDRKFKKS